MAATAQPGTSPAGRSPAAAAGSPPAEPAARPRLAPGSGTAREEAQAGAQSAGSRASTLGRRVVAGLVMAPPVLAGVYAGGVWFFVGTAVVTFLALREFYALSARPRVKLIQPLGFLLALALLLGNGGRDLLVSAVAGATGEAGWPGLPVLAAVLAPDRFAYLARSAVAAAVIVPLIALLFERRDLRGRLVGWALTLAGTLYVAWLMSHFQTLRLLGPPGSNAGRGWVFYTLAATWCFDSGAYLVGSKLGRHRFMTWISPKKTWEGAAGGFALCLLATLLAQAPLQRLVPGLAWLGWAPLPVPLWQVPLLAFAVSLAAQLGDLAESMIKREAGAKDASDLIPGHGGMLDRIDSLLFTVVLVYYYAVLVVS